jgi:hypothetical protein
MKTSIAGPTRGAGKERGSVCATETNRRVRADLVRVIRGADPLQHAPEGARHFGVPRRQVTRMDVKHPVADRSGARVHANDPPAPVEQDRASAQVIEARLDPLRKHGASGRGDGANPFEMMTRPFEFAYFPVFNFSRPPLDAAANFAWHKLKRDETPHLERIEKFILDPLAVDCLPVQNHPFVNERSATPHERGAQLNPKIVVGPAAAGISGGDFHAFWADIADQFFVRAEANNTSAEAAERARETSERLRP